MRGRARAHRGRRPALALLVAAAHLAALALAADPVDRGLPGPPAPAVEVELLWPAAIPAKDGTTPAASPASMPATTDARARTRSAADEPVTTASSPAAPVETATSSSAPTARAGSPPAGRPFHEAWELDAPAGFAYPPAGLDELLEARTRPAMLRVALWIDEAGSLERLDVELEAGLSDAERDAILDTLRAARFEPGRLAGRAVASIKRIEMRHGGTSRVDVATTIPPSDLQE